MSENEKSKKERLYQYAVIVHPTPKARKDGTRAKLVGEIVTILAKDNGEAMLRAARSIPDEYAEKLDRVEVAVRPF